MYLRQTWKEHWLLLKIYRVLLPSHWPAGWWDRLEIAAACYLYSETANCFCKLSSYKIFYLVNTCYLFYLKNIQVLQLMGCFEKQVNAALFCTGLSACYRSALAAKNIRVSQLFPSSRQDFRYGETRFLCATRLSPQLENDLAAGGG